MIQNTQNIVGMEGGVSVFVNGGNHLRTSLRIWGRHGSGGLRLNAKTPMVIIALKMSCGTLGRCNIRTNGHAGQHRNIIVDWAVADMQQ